jgi:hypothetical protein
MVYIIIAENELKRNICVRVYKKPIGSCKTNKIYVVMIKVKRRQYSFHVVLYKEFNENITLNILYK